ncbi:MAG: radical SAM protein [Bacteroidales bacterium]|nr:radical SAM protein [Bacteroidales bacterium]
MKPKLPLVSYEVTMSCNLKCRFCYNHYKNTGDTPQHSSYKMADKTLRRIFKVFDVGQVTFTGGEPFTAERFGELVLTARLKGAKVSVISNGNFAPVERYVELTKLGVNLFELPVHSYNPDVHDFMTRVKGSHQKSQSIISALKGQGVTPTAVLVLTKFNTENVAETIRYIHSLGISQMMLNRYNIGGEGVINPSEIMPSESELKNAFKAISDEALNLKMTVFSSVCTPMCVLNPADYKGIRFSSCSFDITRRPVTIDYLGNLRFCNHSPVVLGNIHTDTPEKIFSNPAAKMWESVVPDYCKECGKFSVCKAGCRAATQQCGMDLDKPDPIIFYYHQN